MIEARIIADSISKYGHRLTTFICTYPRFILAEVNTHRQLSRNSASSRAIPVGKMIEKILAEPAQPVSWGCNKKGMQADTVLEGPELLNAKGAWNSAMLHAVDSARHLLALGVHKQIANRLLEPFAHMTTILTATDWGNFFNLRAHRDAQPEFQELAFEMLAAYDKSDPQWRGDGGWHLPFADKYLDTGVSQENLVKIVTARCARVSYLNFEGDFAFEKDFALHDSLSKSGHWSPFEHAAYVHPSPPASNFTGWFQYRKMFQNENQKVLDTKRLLSTRS